jgi:hypothetical protein
LLLVGDVHVTRATEEERSSSAPNLSITASVSSPDVSSASRPSRTPSKRSSKKEKARTQSSFFNLKKKKKVLRVYYFIPPPIAWHHAVGIVLFTWHRN